MQTIVNTAFIHLHIIPNVIEIRSTFTYTTHHICNKNGKYTRTHSSKMITCGIHSIFITVYNIAELNTFFSLC